MQEERQEQEMIKSMGQHPALAKPSRGGGGGDAGEKKRGKTHYINTV